MSKRLRQMGWSPWLAATMFIPVACWVFGFCCLVLPSAEKRDAERGEAAQARAEVDRRLKENAF